MTIVFVFKNGFELRMKCRDFLLNRNGFQKKSGVEDLEKARWYLNKLIAYLQVKED